MNCQWQSRRVQVTRSIICRISSATPPEDLGLPPGRLDGAPLGGGGDVPAGLPEGAVFGTLLLLFPCAFRLLLQERKKGTGHL